MKQTKIILRIRRFRPAGKEPPRFQSFTLPAAADMSVLDALEHIRIHQDATLMYRHCCHHASCGTCACTINGKPALACTTRLTQLEGDEITLAPLSGFACLGDLAVDMRAFFRYMDARWTNLRACEKVPETRTPPGIGQLTRLENCIECGCCVAACPVSAGEKDFLGPAVLAAANNEIRNRPAQSDALLQLAALPHGANMCRRHLHCSRVCPSAVYPARHINDLQRALRQSGSE